MKAGELLCFLPSLPPSFTLLTMQTLPDPSTLNLNSSPSNPKRLRSQEAFSQTSLVSPPPRSLSPLLLFRLHPTEGQALQPRTEIFPARLTSSGKKETDSRRPLQRHGVKQASLRNLPLITLSPLPPPFLSSNNLPNQPRSPSDHPTLPLLLLPSPQRVLLLLLPSRRLQPRLHQVTPPRRPRILSSSRLERLESPSGSLRLRRRRQRRIQLP